MLQQGGERAAGRLGLEEAKALIRARPEGVSPHATWKAQCGRVRLLSEGQHSGDHLKVLLRQGKEEDLQTERTLTERGDM